MLAANGKTFNDGMRTVFAGFNLRRFGHELHAAEHDDIGVGLGGHAAQFERIADVIGDRMVQRRFHVIVAKDHGAALLLQPIDFVGNTGLDAQLHIGHYVVQHGFELLIHFFW
jgi:hypothetical protein